MRRLAIRPGALGDFIVSLPALEGLRADYFEIWTAGAHVPLIQFADRARSIASTGLDLLGIAAPPRGLIEHLQSFDSIVSWYGANRPEFRDLVYSLGLPFTFFPALPVEGLRIHAVDFYLNQTRAIASSIGDGIPRISCQVKRGDFAVIHPFSGSPKKNWPLANFRALARELETRMPVRWCVGPDDPPLEGAVRIGDLHELACFLASARLYVGNDSGIAHLASAVGTPVIALFGPTDPAIWAPRGARVEIRRF